jgi:MurNAc alpha-1-phosphate uridylyltransferase
MLTVAILAGGLGTRIRPATENIPKSMIEISGKPFLHWQVNLLKKSGVKNIVFCTSYKSETIEEYFGNGSRYGVSIKYSHDGKKQLGTGGAIVNALPMLGEMFMVLYGDSYLPINYSLAEECFLKSKKPALMTIYENKNQYDVSNVIFKEGILKKYSKNEKLPEMNYIDFGLSFFKSTILSKYCHIRTFDLSIVFKDLSEKGLLAGFPVYSRFYEVGSFQGITDFAKFIEEKKHEL